MAGRHRSPIIVPKVTTGNVLVGPGAHQVSGKTERSRGRRRLRTREHGDCIPQVPVIMVHTRAPARLQPFSLEDEVPGRCPDGEKSASRIQDHHPRDATSSRSGRKTIRKALDISWCHGYAGFDSIEGFSSPFPFPSSFSSAPSSERGSGRTHVPLRNIRAECRFRMYRYARTPWSLPLATAFHPKPAWKRESRPSSNALPCAGSTCNTPGYSFVFFPDKLVCSYSISSSWPGRQYSAQASAHSSIGPAA